MTNSIGEIASLTRYPVKSMLGESISSAEFSVYGMSGDRTLALLDVQTGRIASAKQPNLWKQLLSFSARITKSTSGAVLISDSQGRHFMSEGADIDAQLSSVLGRTVKLINARPEGAALNRAKPDEVIEAGTDAAVNQDILVIGAAAPAGGFFDFAPIHIVLTETLSRISDEAPPGLITADRYRPNLVVRGPSMEAFAENAWVGRKLEIGGVTLDVIAPTPRCAVPMLAHGHLPACKQAVSAVVELNQVEFPELGPGTFPCLGVFATVHKAGRIRQGDQVILLGS